VTDVQLGELLEAVGIVKGQSELVMNQRTDRVLIGWLLLASLIGVLAGVPWTRAVLRDHPGAA